MEILTNTIPNNMSSKKKRPPKKFVESYEDENDDDDDDDDDEDDPGSALSRSSSSNSSSKGKWTVDEDDLLRTAVQEFGGRNWKKISECLDGRTDVQCLHRWQKVLRPGLIKGPWTKPEDDKVIELVMQFGVKSWSHIARELQGRLGKQCRERWYNHLSPDINKAAWTLEEDRTIVEVMLRVVIMFSFLFFLILFLVLFYSCDCEHQYFCKAEILLSYSA